MVLVSDICHSLEQFAPPELAEPWDNTGFLVGRSQTEVRTLMTCLTLTSAVAREAQELEAQMIVTHHPILFRGTKKITDQTEEGRILLQLLESGTAVYSPHTSFDSATRGINQQLAESLDLKSIQPLRPHTTHPAAGAGRFGILDVPMNRDKFLKKLSSEIRADYLEHAWHEARETQKIAVACGAAGEFLSDAVRLGCDTFVTGETRFHTVLECQSYGINLVLTGHYCSERPAVEELARILGKRFPELRCFASTMDQNPLRLYLPGTEAT